MTMDERYVECHSGNPEKKNNSGRKHYLDESTEQRIVTVVDEELIPGQILHK